MASIPESIIHPIAGLDTRHSRLKLQGCGFCLVRIGSLSQHPASGLAREGFIHPSHRLTWKIQIAGVFWNHPEIPLLTHSAQVWEVGLVFLTACWPLGLLEGGRGP